MLVLPEGSDEEQIISAKNRLRQYDFLEDSFLVWQAGHPLEVGHRFIQELNFYAVQYLSPTPGQYRNQTGENVTVGDHIPPPHTEVAGHMDDFVSRLTTMFRDAEALELSAYALWRLNWIHPFRQGNGRTSRALSYFLLCQKFNHWLPGQTIPERIRATRPEYCQLMRDADNAARPDGLTDLQPTIDYLGRLLAEQLTA